MSIEILHIDAFSERPFAGNPAAVCFLDEPREEAWMQALAGELNLSETAFLSRRADGHGLRWFTPRVEVDLCGHATLASAHALWETGRLGGDEVARFHTRSGLLTARRGAGAIEMDFPIDVPDEGAPPVGLARALGPEPVGFGAAREYWLAELASEAAVRALAPDFRALVELPARGVIATARGAGEHDFVSRFFAPAVGVDEDPVTGSAHCVLAPYWSGRLGRESMRGLQASRRGGTVGVRIAGERVLLLGQAVTVLRGKLA